MGKISIVLRLDKPRQRLQFYTRVSEYFPILYSSGARFYISFIFRCVANVAAEKTNLVVFFVWPDRGLNSQYSELATITPILIESDLTLAFIYWYVVAWKIWGNPITGHKRMIIIMEQIKKMAIMSHLTVLHATI